MPAFNKRTLPPLFAVLLAALGPACAPAQEAVSTAAAARVQSPLYLTISRNSDEGRIGLDYRIRWDFSDLGSLRPGLGFIYSGLKAIYNWDITENTRLEYYGLRTNPWRLIITKEKKPVAAAAPAAAGGGGIVAPAPVYRKRVRFSISPLVDDLKRNFDDDLRDFLLRSSLSSLSPDWEHAGDAGRKAFMKDVLSLGIWNSGAPVITKTREGLEYISTDGEKKPKKN